MPNHKSSIKRVRQTEKRNERNSSLRASLRTEIKKFKSLLESGASEEAQQSYPSVQKKIDKATTKGILPSKTAARYKSRLVQQLNKILSA